VILVFSPTREIRSRIRDLTHGVEKGGAAVDLSVSISILGREASQVWPFFAQSL